MIRTIPRFFVKYPGYSIYSIFFLIFLFQVSFANDKSFHWQTASPESQGLFAEKLDALKDSLAKKNTKTFLIIRNDKIVYEWYAPDFNQDRSHYTASLAKALVGGMSLLVALNDGLISIDAPACNYVKSWKQDEDKSKITIRHLATHSSGIEDAEQDTISHFDLPGWKGAFWKKEPDPFSVSRDFAPVLFTPGSQYAYSNPGMAMLAYSVTACLKKTPQKDIRSYLDERIMEPIGVKKNEWSIGYDKTYNVDNLELVPNWGGGSFTARAVARVGRLMLNKGNWQGKQLIDSTWVKRIVRYAGTPLPKRTEGNPQPGSGLGWYTNFDGVWPQVPRDAFAGAGAGNQVLLVVPSLNLIVVRNGGNLYDPDKNEGFWGGLEKYLFNPVMEALNEPPYPQSELIVKTEFDPPASIIRKAEGSDNWPVTWGENEVLYTAYGDGWGFQPRADIKLSLGLAKITGVPPDIHGINIRSNSGERVGQGKYGIKASGLLMVDGILYMLVRNAENSQLGWSEDQGKTWSWCDWTFKTSFGCPTFLNFGKNYENAGDNYVYIYSHDDNSAYQPADRMVLVRVPKDRMTDRNAYEFFEKLDSQQKPVWTIDIRQRGAVFTNPAQCYRSGITYNAALKRYMWCQIIPGKDTRFEGGLGIYEAPEPWGPWKTVYYTREWDVGPGETASIPTKWMSPDGKSAYLLFSGDDALSVRKVIFTISEEKL